ncbi:RIP metalloprotease RseP [Fictibacillus barbaricus]|uniref:Zinc metalloprotease n=1 Tax=Fictibacillus barbaricus TaxID=182136 RepID=A0ABU1TY81_9BACL|nr:RIP metalloprotease RseP [Fictibacillus barbaricus]MDR7072176.1 regulator of sigma E protease [Fictibacillus barbaricus]
MNTVIAIIIILGALIFFHELGHLLLAKRAGILCREFAIGFGPKVFAFKKGETVYTIRLLPLGGFVRMAGEDPEGIELKAGHRVGLIFNNANEVEKIIVNHREKYPVQKTITLEKADLEHDLTLTGFENEEAGLSTYKVKEDALFVADHQEMQIAPYNRQFGSKTIMQRTLAIFAGPLMNFLLAFIILVAFSLMQGIPTNESRLGTLQENAAADKAGLQKGDKVVAIQGDKMDDWKELVSVIQQNPGEKLMFTIVRNGKEKVVPITLGSRKGAGDQNEGFIGAHPYTESSVLGSIQYGAKQTWFMTTAIFTGISELITGQHGIEQLSGPLGIYEYTDQAAKAGIFMLLQWAAILSINLGIFNLLPLPALDGGRLLFLGVEALRGKPIDPQKEGLVHFIGFAFLMLLMLVVTWNDIQKIFLS